MDGVLPALLEARTGGEGETIGVECESLSLEGAEGARGELVLGVGGGRVVVRLRVWGGRGGVGLESVVLAVGRV